MKKLVFLLAKYTGLFALARWLTRNQIRVLAYHGIWLGEGHFGNFLYMSADKFSKRMAKLQEMNFPVLGLSEAFEKKLQGRLPRNAVVITIDDGWYSTYTHMLPVLESRKLPATVYVTTYYAEKQQPVFDVALQYLISATQQIAVDVSHLNPALDRKFSLVDDAQKHEFSDFVRNFASGLTNETDRQGFLKKIAELLGIDIEAAISEKWFHLMSFDQVRDMSERGFDVQLHTHRHRISHSGEYSIEQEVHENRERLGPYVQGELQHFCYPSGIYEKGVWPLLEKLHIQTATTTDIGLVDDDTQDYAWSRILDGENITELEFEAELSGFSEVIRQTFRT